MLSLITLINTVTTAVGGGGDTYCTHVKVIQLISNMTCVITFICMSTRIYVNAPNKRASSFTAPAALERNLVENG